MLFGGWKELVRVFVFGVTAYVALVFILRLSGKRTLSKMDTFDFVITTALGSALAQVVIAKDSALATGLAAFAVIIGLQFVSTWLSKHTRLFRRLIKDEPTLIYFRGEFVEAAMKRERVSADEILASVRSSGFASLEDVEAVVLEADSSFSVIRRAEGGKTNSSLINVSQVRPDSDEPVSTAGRTKPARRATDFAAVLRYILGIP